MKSHFSNKNSFEEFQTRTFSFHFVMILDPSNSKNNSSFEIVEVPPKNCYCDSGDRDARLQEMQPSKARLPKGIPDHSPEN